MNDVAGENKGGGGQFSWYQKKKSSLKARAGEVEDNMLCSAGGVSDSQLGLIG